jgi:UDP-N-acetyl-D-mannosaminuronate dehydrogenase
MSLVELQNKIEQRQAVIGVIGLGYVGLPVVDAEGRPVDDHVIIGTVTVQP